MSSLGEITCKRPHPVSGCQPFALTPAEEGFTTLFLPISISSLVCSQAVCAMDRTLGVPPGTVHGPTHSRHHCTGSWIRAWVSASPGVY